MNIRALGAAVLAVSLLSAGTAHAETFSACYPMVGKVRDAIDRPISGATVRSSNACSGFAATTTTDATGRYELRVPGDALGATVTLTAMKTGYSGGSQSGSVSKVGSVDDGLDKDIKIAAAETRTADTTRSSSSTQTMSSSSTETVSSSSSAETVSADTETTSASSSSSEELTYRNTDFKLLLAFTPGVTAAVRPGSPVTVTARVASPPPGGTGENPALVLAEEEATGARVELTAAADGPGWTMWSGTFTAPTGVPDGGRRVRVCAVRPAYAGSCAAAGTADLLAPVALPQYVLDGTPPVLTATSPGPFRTVTRFWNLTANWTDATAGLPGTAGSLRVWVDGVERTPSISGGYLSAVVNGLPHGIHTMELQATDRAGNTSRREQIFTFAKLTATPATATLATATVDVNPTNKIPPPSSVTFKAPRVDVGAFTETVSASTWVGEGTVRRPYHLGTVQVRFVNESGVPKDVPVTVYMAYATHEVVLVTPTGHEQRIEVPIGTATLADITVTVPAGYGTPGAKATLMTAAAQLGPSETVSAELAPSPLGQVTVSGELDACVSDLPEDPRCASGQESFASVSLKRVGIPVYPATDSDDDATGPACEDASDAPGTCDTTAEPKNVKAHAVFGCADMVAWLTFVAGTQSVDLCNGQRRTAPARPSDGAAAAYLNAWVYEAANLYPAWHQSHVDAPASGSACPNGKTGTTRGYVHRAAASVVPLDGATAPDHSGVWRPPIAEWTQAEPVDVELGRVQTPTLLEDGSVGTVVREDRGFRLKRTIVPLDSDRGEYGLLSEAWIDALGRRHARDGATSNWWQATTADVGASGVAADVLLTTGTTYSPGATNGYARAFSLAFQVVLDFRGCA